MKNYYYILTFFIVIFFTIGCDLTKDKNEQIENESSIEVESALSGSELGVNECIEYVDFSDIGEPYSFLNLNPVSNINISVNIDEYLRCCTMDDGGILYDQCQISYSYNSTSPTKTTETIDLVAGKLVLYIRKDNSADVDIDLIISKLENCGVDVDISRIISSGYVILGDYDKSKNHLYLLNTLEEIEAVDFITFQNAFFSGYIDVAVEDGYNSEDLLPIFESQELSIKSQSEKTSTVFKEGKSNIFELFANLIYLNKCKEIEFARPEGIVDVVPLKK